MGFSRWMGIEAEIQQSFRKHQFYGPYLSFATQDRQEDEILLMKQTINCKEKAPT